MVRINKEFLDKVLKFGLVGVIATLLNYGSFYLLYKIFGSHYLLSSVTGYISGVLLGYFLNKYWTFVKQVDISKNYLVGYFLVYLVSLVVSQLFLLVLVEVMFLNPLVSNIFAICVSTVLNFTGSNYLVFKIKPRTIEDEKE
jgi:putative flippase GtrA